MWPALNASGDLEVTYWIGKTYWGKGVATKALSLFLAEQKTRPIFARAAHDNSGSIRVLEKCGFVIVGHDSAYANARGQDVDEVIMELTGREIGRRPTRIRLYR